MMNHRGGIMKTISGPLYMIVFYGSTLITRHDDSSRSNLFLEDYPISASLFVFRGSNTKFFFRKLPFLLLFDALTRTKHTNPSHMGQGSIE